MKLPIQLRKRAKTPAQRKVKMSTLLQKAFAAGWHHSGANSTVLVRFVPWDTRETFWTSVFRGNASATEHISQINLQYLTPRSRVFRNLL